MLKLFGKIVNGKFVFSTPNHKEKQLKFAKENNGKDFEINIMQFQKAEYFQFKYYWGVLLPSICDFYGSVNTEYIHFHEVKKRFLFYPINNNDISVIPENHKKKIMFIADNENITGYVRSLSSLDSEEFKIFNNRVEKFIFDELNYRIIEEKQEEYASIKRAMNSDLFDKEVDIENDTHAF